MASDSHHLILATWLVLGLIFALGGLRLKAGMAAPASPTRALELTTLVCAAVLLFSSSPTSTALNASFLPPSTALAWTGVTVVVGGAAVAVWARVHLAGNWSAAAAIRHGQRIVATGPYAWVRHPIYSGVLMAAVGTAIGFDQMRDLFALPLLVFGFWLKARSEERLLIQEFGTEYVSYRSRVRGAVVPFLL